MVLQLQAWAFMLFQERAVSFDMLAMWGNMQWPARTVVIVLFIMSAWSIGVMIDRWIAYNGARKQSRACSTARSSSLPSSAKTTWDSRSLSASPKRASRFEKVSIS